MQEFIEQIEFPFLLIISGIILFSSNLIVFLIFLKNKELRSGIYGTILATIFAELYVAFHSITYSILAFSRVKIGYSWFCIFESFISIFFSLFWVCENTSIMLLYLTRNIVKSKLCRNLHLTSFLFSLIISLILLLNESLGLSSINTCYIKKESNHSLFFIAGCFYFLFILSIMFNVWFFKFRDTNKDRSFINGYNYFILISSFLNAAYFFNLMIDYFVEADVSFLNFFSIIFLFFASLYTAIFRIKIEHITLFFSDEEGKNKYKNILKFIFCKYTLPKFKEIKKRLNVKFIDTTDNEKDKMIYNHIFNNKDFT